MTYRRHSMLLLIVLTSCSFGHSQEAGKATSNQSVYKNFLGNWEGSSERLHGNRIVREVIGLVVTEEPSKHRLRFDYQYDRMVDAYPMRRFLNLDPSNETVTMQWDGFSKDKCTASGLKEFALTGMGDFTAICRSSDDHRLDRMTLHLRVDSLDYEWAASADGKIFVVYSKFSFKRKP